MNTPNDQYREGESVADYMQRIGMTENDMTPTAQEIRQDIDATLNVEAVYAAEHQRLRSAVDRAVALGIVREELLPARQPSGRSCYLLSSAHFTPYKPGQPSIVDQIRSSQIELFRLLHLIHESGASSPLFVEGRTQGISYTAFSVKRPVVSTPQGEKDIWDPCAQAHLFDHPGQLHDIINEQYEIAVDHRRSVPIFYQYVPYKAVMGGESPQTNAQGASIIPLLQQSKTFYQRYGSFLRSLNHSGETMIATSWDKNGIPIMQFGNDWLHAEQVAHDCENFMHYAEAMRHSSKIRENDMSHFIRHTPPQCVPMGFMGLYHILRLAEDLRDTLDVRVLTPTSSIAHDNKRMLTEQDDPPGISVIPSLLDAARRTMLQKPPTS